jgi:hypothetical protein
MKDVVVPHRSTRRELERECHRRGIGGIFDQQSDLELCQRRPAWIENFEIGSPVRVGGTGDVRGAGKEERAVRWHRRRRPPRAPYRTLSGYQNGPDREAGKRKEHTKST